MAFNEGFGSSGIDNFGNKTERKETTPEQVDNRKQDAEQSLRLAQGHYEAEKPVQIAYGKAFDTEKEHLFSGLMSIKDFSDGIQEKETTQKDKVKPVEPDKISVKPPENNQTINEEINERERVLELGSYANLAYAKYGKIDKSGGTTLDNLSIRDVGLDIGNLDITKFDIDSTGNIAVADIKNLTPDEQFVFSNFNKTSAITENIVADPNISEIVDFALFKNQSELKDIALERTKLINLADADIPNSDADKSYSPRERLKKDEERIIRLTKFIKENRVKLTSTIIQLKEKKTSEYQIQFNSLKDNERDKGELKILAYYPEEGSKDKSGFQCVLFEKGGKKILSIAGTQLNNIINADVGDLKADFSIFLGKIPEAQTKSMINFFRNNKDKLSPTDKLIIVGHSLGGTLAQEASCIYGKSYNLEETYTFNSPGAKELTNSITSNDPYYLEIQDFTNNRIDDKIGDKITNVKGTEGISPIAEKGKDVGKYRIDVKTASHGINSILEAAKESDKLVSYEAGTKQPRKYNRSNKYKQ